MTVDAIAIASATIVPFRFALRGPASNARSAWSERRGLLLRLEAEGHVGWGEASPLPGYSPDTLADAEADLRRACAALRTFETGPVEATLTAACSLALGPSASFALETALLDLRARIEARPVWRLLAPSAAPLPVPLGTVLRATTASACAEEAAAAARRGLACVKMKVGRRGAIDDEIASLRAVREVVGPSFPIRLDANGSFTHDEARAAIARFSREGPEFIEEPVTGEIWRAFASGGRASVPLAIDETLAMPQGGELARVLLEERIVDVVVLKLGIVGGFRRALALASTARSHGADVVVTHMYEGPIATAAAGALALAVAGVARRPAGLDVAAYATFELGDAHPIATTHVRPTDGIGLGATPDALLDAR